ncbi:hypothetical protein ACGFZQ_09870 [Streptomyces sp. NPDC048254]|uniref:hypothetical protein n=1 Tax=Streptomyces sp. NPDC048254 TaxID=3365525 RepID=UPI0037125499
MSRWRSTGLLAAICAVCLTGCSTLGEREAAASRTALRFEESVQQKDGARACAALAPETRQEVEQSAKKPCAQALFEEQLPQAVSVHGADVYGQQARVVLNGDTLFLSAFPVGWKITAAGCVPRPRRPYQCQIKGG